MLFAILNPLMDSLKKQATSGGLSHDSSYQHTKILKQPFEYLMMASWAPQNIQRSPLTKGHQGSRKQETMY